jgi:hypothetical protein
MMANMCLSAISLECDARGLVMDGEQIVPLARSIAFSLRRHAEDHLLANPELFQGLDALADVIESVVEDDDPDCTKIDIPRGTKICTAKSIIERFGNII